MFDISLAIEIVEGYVKEKKCFSFLILIIWW